MMVLSCGALLDDFDLIELARRHGGRILVPTGAARRRSHGWTTKLP
jgi:aspartate dehydrogenase